MKNGYTYFFVIIFIAFFLFSCGTHKPIKYIGIDRTLGLLKGILKESQNDFEILFYGQSIIGGMKTNILIDSLKGVYPNTNITFKHKPIGGFTISKLIKTAEHDIYQENPDLIVFHAYGGINDGLYDSLVKNIRCRMATDVLLLDHHYVWDKPEKRLEAVNKSHDFDSKEIKKIAKKYGCAFVDVRKEWGEYLTNKNIGVNELMGNTVDPNVHPNDKGNVLLRSIVLSAFKGEPIMDYNKKKDLIRSSKKYTNKPKEINTSFLGNRLELLTDIKLNDDAKISILIDGKEPSTFKSNFCISRPTKGFKSWMPALLNVSFGTTFPKEEKWTIEIYNINREEKTFKFKLYGSLTGFDGEGSSEKDFFSNSKRIEIKKENFYVFQIEDITKKNTPEGFKIEFSVIQLVKDIINLNKQQSKYNLFKSVLVKKYNLDLKVVSGNPSIKELLVSQPFLNINE